VKPTLRAKLDSLVGRLETVNRLLAAEDATRNLDQFRSLSREHAELSGVVALYERYRQAEGDAEAARELALDEELKSTRALMERLEGELQRALLPKDPNDERNLFLEVRAGTGGDESALFAGDLIRMYLRYAERRGWQTEIISESPAELGGYKEVVVRIAGQGWRKLRRASGEGGSGGGRLHPACSSVRESVFVRTISDASISTGAAAGGQARCSVRGYPRTRLVTYVNRSLG